MPNIYTPEGGNTSQGNALQQLQDTLRSITSVSPAAKPLLESYVNQSNAAEAQSNNIPNYQAQQGQAMSEAGQFPQGNQAFGDLTKLHAMFTADQNMSQQYTRPDMRVGGGATQQPSDVATFGSVGAPQMPVMTAESLSQPFQGFTDPYLAAEGANTQSEGISGMAKALKSIIDTNYESANKTLQRNLEAEKAQIDGKWKAAQSALQAFELIMNAEQKAADRAQEERKIAISEATAKSNMRTKGEIVDVAGEDGTTQKVLVDPYTGQTLATIGNSASAVSGAQKTQLGLWNSTISQLNNDWSKIENGIDKTGPTAILNQKLGPYVGGADKDLRELDVFLSSLKMGIQNAMIGSQMSKPEMDQVMAWYPTITMTPDEIRTRIDNIRTFLAAKKASITGEDFNKLLPKIGKELSPASGSSGQSSGEWE